MDTEKRTTNKVSSPDMQLEIDLLDGEINSQKNVEAIPVSNNKNTENKKFLKKEKKSTEE